MVIGEAMNNILRIDPEIKISNGRNIVNARNLLIHNYSGVNENVLWEIIKIHLPILKEEVGNILND